MTYMAISVKNHKYFSPRAYNTTIEGFPLEFSNGSRSQKLECPTRWRETDNLYNCYNTLPAQYGQRDRQRWTKVV